jgi:hypothetical protein
MHSGAVQMPSSLRQMTGDTQRTREGRRLTPLDCSLSSSSYACTREGRQDWASCMDVSLNPDSRRLE